MNDIIEMTVPILSIKQIEKKVSRTYTDDESVINKVEQLAVLTNRSLNETLKEIVNNFISHGKIYDPINNEYYSIEEFIKNSKGTLE